MAATKQYSTDMLKAGDTFVVIGRTSYPRLTHVIDGEELQQEIQRATQSGRPPVTVPHTYTTLVDAAVEYKDPNAPTLAECFAAERMYINKDGKTCYTATRKTATLADYGIVDPVNPSNVKGIYLDPNKVLANGLLVKCYFRIFDTKAGMHKGVSLDAIVFQEPVKYYEFSNTNDELANRGLTWTPPEGDAPIYNPVAEGTIPSAPPAYNPGVQTPAPPMNPPTAYAPAPTSAPAPAPTPAAPATSVDPAQAAAAAAAQAAAEAQRKAEELAAQAAAAQAAAEQKQAEAAAATAQVPPAPQPQPQPQAQPTQQIGNTGTSAFDGAYIY